MYSVLKFHQRLLCYPQCLTSPSFLIGSNGHVKGLQCQNFSHPSKTDVSTSLQCTRSLLVDYPGQPGSVTGSLSLLLVKPYHYCWLIGRVVAALLGSLGGNLVPSYLDLTEASSPTPPRPPCPVAGGRSKDCHHSDCQRV